MKRRFSSIGRAKNQSIASGQPVDHVAGTPVADDLHEPDGAARVIDRGGDLGTRRVVAVVPVRHVDDRHERRRAPVLLGDRRPRCDRR